MICGGIVPVRHVQTVRSRSQISQPYPSPSTTELYFTVTSDGLSDATTSFIACLLSNKMRVARTLGTGLGFYCRINSGSKSDSYDVPVSTKRNGSFHLVMVQESDVVKVYCDGVYVGSFTNTTSATQAAGYVQLGYYSALNKALLGVTRHLFRVFNRDMTSLVPQLYGNRNHPINYPGLMYISYDFAGAGTVCVDQGDYASHISDDSVCNRYHSMPDWDEW